MTNMNWYKKLEKCKKWYLSIVQAIFIPKKFRIIRNMKYYDNAEIDYYDYWNHDYIRIKTLQLMAEEIKRREIGGGVAELGVYQGDFSGTLSILFPDRKIYLFDTFEGFDHRDKKSEGVRDFDDFSNTSVEMVMKKLKHPENAIIRRGWFPETTNGLEKERFCFVSLDADLYEPIKAGLEFFYDLMERGGVIFVHDYNDRKYQGSQKAVREYCDRKGIFYTCLPDVYGTAIIIKQ